MTTPREILTDAAKIMRKRGRTTGRMTRENGCVCMLGSMLIAAGVDVLLEDAWTALDDRTTPLGRAVRRCYDIVIDRVVERGWAETRYRDESLYAPSAILWRFNDTFAHDDAEVLEVFALAAKEG